jgi:hypothetical protein
VRAFGWLFVALSLACGPIGLRARELETASPRGAASETPHPGSAVCEPPARSFGVLSVPLRRPEGSSRVIPLNAGGYNYTPPSDSVLFDVESSLGSDHR